MKNFFSYIIPQTRKIKSDINGYLELTKINGKKLLDSKNANYSYGSLQRVMRFGLNKMQNFKPANVLLLGLGGGCVIDLLRNEFDFEGKITAVELDKVVIEIAEQEFGHHQDKNLEIICDDAFNFINTNSSKYDLIIVDLFIDTEIPDFCYTVNFWKTISKLSPLNSYLIFNSSIDKGKNRINNKNPEEIISQFYESKVYEKVEGHNELVIGRKKQRAGLQIN